MNKGTRADVLERVYGAKSNEELEMAYDEWAEHYDADVFKFGYLFPAVAAGYIGRHIPAGSTLVDAGAGTGIMGRVLHAMEYGKLSGFDLSRGMLDRAAKIGVYKHLDRQVLGERLKYPADSFDACVSIWTFTEGHAPASGFDEIARIVRPGGWFVVTIRADVFERDGFAEKSRTLADARKLKLIDKSETFRVFSESEPDIVGNVYVYQVG